MPILATSLLSISLAIGTSAAPLHADQVLPAHVDPSQWEIAMGDRFLVDTSVNQGYLIHPDGTYLTFPVVTGQNRYVRYIGRTYKATTPTWNWEVQEMNIKGDHLTFGPSGRFLRLYKDNEETAYGIHEYGREEDLFSPIPEERFRSMGCVIVRTGMMDIIVKTFEMNEGKLQVKTVFGIPEGSDLLAIAQA